MIFRAIAHPTAKVIFETGSDSKRSPADSQGKNTMAIDESYLLQLRTTLNVKP
jgi:hypothetical protein